MSGCWDEGIQVQKQKWQPDHLLKGTGKNSPGQNTVKPRRVQAESASDKPGSKGTSRRQSDNQKNKSRTQGAWLESWSGKRKVERGTLPERVWD